MDPVIYTPRGFRGLGRVENSKRQRRQQVGTKIIYYYRRLGNTSARAPGQLQGIGFTRAVPGLPSDSEPCPSSEGVSPKRATRPPPVEPCADFKKKLCPLGVGAGNPNLITERYHGPIASIVDSAVAGCGMQCAVRSTPFGQRNERFNSRDYNAPRRRNFFPSPGMTVEYIFGNNTTCASRVRPEQCDIITL